MEKESLNLKQSKEILVIKGKKMDKVKFYVGIVENNEDSDNLNRVQVKLNAETEDSTTKFLRCVSRMAGNGEGISSIPNVHDQVLVVRTETGEDFVLGRLWNETQKPPASGENGNADFNKDGKNSLTFIKTKSGNKIIFDDTDKDEKIQIISSKNDTRIELCAKDKKISMKGQKISMSAKGDISVKSKNIKVKATETISIESKNLVSKASGETKIEASGDLTLKGKSIGLN